MSEETSPAPKPPRRRFLILPGLALLLLAAAAIGAAALDGGEDGDRQVPDLDGGRLPTALRHLVLHDSAIPLPAHILTDGTGAETGLDALDGKWRVVNFWATWCTPCRAEMPALDRLEAALGGDRFATVAISLDREGAGKVRKFYEENRITNLAIHLDPGQKFATAMNVIGLPATLVVDPAGREVGRLVGEAEWDAPEVVEFFRALVAADGG